MLAFLDAVRQRLQRLRPALNDELNQRQIIERRHLPAFFRADVGVNQMPHGRLVLLQVNGIATVQLHLVAEVLVEGDFLFDRLSLGSGVTRLGHFAGKFGVGAHQRRGQFVQRQALRFVRFELRGIARIFGRKISQVGRLILRRGNRLAQCPHLLQRVFQSLLRLAEPILQQPGHIFLVVTVQCARGVIMHRPFQAFEQILVVNDVAVFLVFAVQPVHPADGLEQAVIAHLLVNVEIRGRGRVKAGEQLVHHDQQLHLAGLFDELFLHRQLELPDPVHGFLRRFIEPVRQHFLVNAILLQLVAFAFAGILAFDIGYGRNVGSDNGAPAVQVGFIKLLKEFARLVNAARDEDRVAAPARQPVALREINQDVPGNFVQP